MNVAMKFLVFVSAVAIVCSAYDMSDDDSDMIQPCGGQPSKLASRIHPDLPSKGFPSKAREYQSIAVDSTIWKYNKGEWCFNLQESDPSRRTRRNALPFIPRLG